MSRQIKRIPIIIEFFRLKNQDALREFLDNIELPKTPRALLSKEFEDFWLEHYDLRLGQALINFGSIPDGYYWSKEEQDWLLEERYFLPEEILFWGRNFDKEGNKLDKTEYILLKDLTTDHIKNIKKYFGDKYESLHSKYKKYFNKRLEEE